MPEQKDSNRLQRQLESYSSSAASLRAVNTNAGFRNWARFAAAAGSALAMSTAADANIIYSGPVNLTITGPGGGRSTHVLINGLFFYIAAFYGKTSNSTFFSRGGNARFGGTGGILRNASGQVQRLFSGSKISTHAGAFSNGRGALRTMISASGRGPSHQSFGTWAAGQAAFAGIQLGPGEFGWVRLRFDETPAGFPNSTTMIDWAYNTNGAIDAGDTGGVALTPEPASWTLLALAAGATGILALRRRRNSANAR